jgi:hypothetical protein
MQRKGCNQKLNKRKATQNKLGKMVIEAGLHSQVQNIASKKKKNSAEGSESVGFTPTLELAAGRKRRISEMDTDTPHLQETPPKSQSRRTSLRLAIKRRADEHEPQDTQVQNESCTNGPASLKADYDDQPQVPINMRQSVMTPLEKSPLEVDYMVEILKLLGLRIETYTWYNLDDLRFYAHTHNAAYQNEKWYHPDLPKGHYGRSNSIYHNEKGLLYAHFAEYLERVRNIAIDREDIDKDGVYSPNRPKRLFTIEQVDKDLKRFQEQALGIAANKFGIHLFHEPFNF